MDSKIALFIDGANLYTTAKALGFDIDYKLLMKEFQGRGTLVRAFYYAVIIEDQEFSIRPLTDWLGYNGFTVVTKPAKEFDDGVGRRKLKRSMKSNLLSTPWRWQMMSMRSCCFLAMETTVRCSKRCSGAVCG